EGKLEGQKLEDGQGVGTPERFRASVNACLRIFVSSPHEFITLQKLWPTLGISRVYFDTTTKSLRSEKRCEGAERDSFNLAAFAGAGRMLSKLLGIRMGIGWGKIRGGLKSAPE